MGNSTWELFPQSDSYNASSDTSFFSTSLPVIAHENFRVNEQIHENQSLLPNDDEFLEGMVNELVADSEEYDFFGSGGGLELGPDFQETSRVGVSSLNLTDHSGASGNKGALSFASGMCPIAGEHPLGEHPSRTLFVRNISSNVEDAELRTLFEQYGDIRTMYTACKHRGFVMISYYDIRAARKAMRSLQNQPLRRRNLDIHFSIPKETPTDKEINQGTLVALNLDPSVSNDDLHKIFGAFGEVKEIRETPHKIFHKFIEFYDVRSAERALKSLNRSDIAGKRIKLEPSRPGGIRRSLLLNPNGNLELDEGNLHKIGSLLGFSPPGNMAHLSSSMEHNPPKNFSKSPVFGATGTPFSNNVPGLASVLNQPIGKNGPPIRNHYLDPIFANGSSNNRGIFKHSHSFPEKNLSNVSTFGQSDFNGSTSKLLCGPHQLLWGNNGFNFLGHFHAESARLERKFGYFQEPTNGSFEGPGYEASYNNHIFGRNSVMDNQSPVFGMPSISPSPVFLGNGHFPQGLAVSNIGGSLAERRFQTFDGKGIQSDNKGQFLIYLDKITSGEDAQTTLMIKNIPNKYTSKMLMAAIDKHNKGTYDFLYLPIDFKNKCNVGYAFINMLSPLSIIPFYKEFNGKKWEKFNSDKISSLAYGRIQGKAALVAHFQKSSLMNEDKGFRPIIINSEGTESNDMVKKTVPENLHTLREMSAFLKPPPS